MDLLQQVHGFLALEIVRLDAVLQVGIHEAGACEKG